MRKSKERKDKMVKMEEERKRNALRSTNEVNDKAERNSVRVLLAKWSVYKDYVQYKQT